MRLQKCEIEALACPPGKQDMIVFDDALPGFAMRLSAAGAKTFIFQYRRGKQVRRLVLGRFGTMTPAQARKAATVARGQVSAGRDPVAEHAHTLAVEAAEREDRKAKVKVEAFTLEKLVEDWAEKGLAGASASHRKEAPAAIRRCFAASLQRPAADLKAADVQRRVDGIAEKHPPMARRVRDYARAAFNWALGRGLVSANPFAAVRIEGREVSRDRALTDAELGGLWRAVTGMAYPFGPLLRLLILTLQRRNEVAGMRWSELAPDLATWTLPGDRAKNRKAHIVPLPEAARAVLRELPRIAGRDLIFTTTGRTKVSGFTHAQDQVLRRMRKEAEERPGPRAAELPPWRRHDLRRTGVTTLARLGIAPHVADRMLNHVQSTIRGVAAVYQRHEFMAEREAAAKLWAEHVLAAAVPAETTATGPAEQLAGPRQRRRRVAAARLGVAKA